MNEFVSLQLCSLKGNLSLGRFSTCADMKECVDRFFLGLADCSGCHLSSLCSPAINLAVNLRWLLSAFERLDSTFDHFLEMLIAKVFVFESSLFETALSNIRGYFKKYDNF